MVKWPMPLKWGKTVIDVDGYDTHILGATFQVWAGTQSRRSKIFDKNDRAEAEAVYERACQKNECVDLEYHVTVIHLEKSHGRADR